MNVKVIVEDRPTSYRDPRHNGSSFTLNYPDRATADEAVKHIIPGLESWHRIRIMEEVKVTTTEYKCVDVVEKPQ